MKAEELKKVQCITHEHNYYVEDDSIPVDAEVGDAFPSTCPLCGCRYAVLQE